MCLPLSRFVYHFHQLRVNESVVISSESFWRLREGGELGIILEWSCNKFGKKLGAGLLWQFKFLLRMLFLQEFSPRKKVNTVFVFTYSFATWTISFKKSVDFWLWFLRLNSPQNISWSSCSTRRSTYSSAQRGRWWENPPVGWGNARGERLR